MSASKATKLHSHPTTHQPFTMTLRRTMLQSILILLVFAGVQSIWPPDYDVKLKYEEEFVISELLDRSDVQDIYDEEELISREQQLHQNVPDKYFRLHSLSQIKNSQQDKKPPTGQRSRGQLYPESNPDLDEPQPWIAGFVDQHNNNIAKDEDTVYFDEAAQSNQVEKREAQNSSDYNYDELKAHYDDSVKKADVKEDTLKYTEVKEEERPDEVVKSLVEMTPRNCTKEETSGLGMGDVRCFWLEMRSKHLNSQNKVSILKKVVLIATIWLLAYCLIAVPLWCQYGWCCCCCKCKFCRPREDIDHVKQFCANNPPGVFHDTEGNLKKYKPTAYEMYAQKNLQKAIERI